MKTKSILNKVSIVLFLVLIISESGTSQDSSKVLIVSSKVGELIDSTEKAKYNIFPFYSKAEFQSAQFAQMADSSIVLKAIIKDGSIKKKLISEKEFLWTKTIIDGGNKQNINYNKSNTVYSERPQYIERPPISGGRVVGEIFAGGALGFVGVAVGGIGGVLMGFGLARAIDENFLFEGVVIGAVVGAGIGSTLGATGGVYLVGISSDVTGSLGATVGGALLGTIGGGALIVAAYSAAASGGGGAAPLAVIAFFLPTIGATIAFNSTRRYKSSGTANSINLGFNQNGVLLTYKF